jgi:DNA-binding GntR family transcriptional regulator
VSGPELSEEERLDGISSLGRPALVDRLAQLIHAGILSGEYPIEGKLRQEALARQYGVSRTPIREALRKLESQGLVDILPRQGALVRGPTAKTIREAYLVRAELEGLAAELATSRIDDEGLMQLRAAEQEFRIAARDLAVLIDGDEMAADDSWVRANDLFHEAIFRAAGNERLHRTITELHMLFPRSLTWSALANRPHLVQENAEEHRRVLEAIERREPGAARLQMSYHVRRAGELVAQRFERDNSPEEGLLKQ